MPRGGYRPGAGRKKSALPKVPKIAAVTEAEVVGEAQSFGMTPKEYMLKVMNDLTAGVDRRDRMAIAAAPFLHAKAEAENEGKKAQRQASAEKASSAGKFAVPDGPKLVVNNKR
jgi:hypothetical protein